MKQPSRLPPLRSRLHRGLWRVFAELAVLFLIIWWVLG